MSQKNEPKFDKDVELAKVNLVAEEWRSSVLLNLGTLLSVTVGLDAVLYASVIANQTSTLAATILVVFFSGFFGSSGYLISLRPYRKRIRRLNTLLDRIRDGQPIEDLETLLKKS